MFWWWKWQHFKKFVSRNKPIETKSWFISLFCCTQTFNSCFNNQTFCVGAAIVAQLAERLFPIPEVRGSNPVTGTNFMKSLINVDCEKTKITKKRWKWAHFLKKYNTFLLYPFWFKFGTNLITSRITFESKPSCLIHSTGDLWLANLTIYNSRVVLTR